MLLFQEILTYPGITTFLFPKIAHFFLIDATVLSSDKSEEFLLVRLVFIPSYKCKQNCAIYIFLRNTLFRVGSRVNTGVLPKMYPVKFRHAKI